MQTLSKKSPFGALLSRTLPTYKGPHKVGVFDIEVPVESPRNIGSFRVKGMKDQEPGFKLESECGGVLRWTGCISQPTSSRCHRPIHVSPV